MHERLIGARGDSIVSSHWYGKTNKRQLTKITRPYPRVSEATRYHAEARIPEITWHRPLRHNDSPEGTSKQTPATPGRNESGEKLGEMEGETRANVKKS